MMKMRKMRIVFEEMKEETENKKKEEREVFEKGTKEKGETEEGKIEVQASFLCVSSLHSLSYQSQNQKIC